MHRPIYQIESIDKDDVPITGIRHISIDFNPNKLKINNEIIMYQNIHIDKNIITLNISRNSKYNISLKKSEVIK